jgi:outer membrane murein-binding lipoprotein Lpp
MLPKKVTSLLICAVILMGTVPSGAFAQTHAQNLLASSVGSSGDAQAKLKQDLRASFAEVMAKTRAGTLTERDIKRFETDWLNPQTTAKAQSGMTRKEKVLIYSIVAGLVGLAVILGIKTGKGGHGFCDTDPTDPDCIGPYP